MKNDNIVKIKGNTLKQGLKYCNDVISGKIIACKPIIQACQRFKNDLERFKKPRSEYIYKEEWAKNFLVFCNKYVKHTSGDMANKPFILSPWQVFAIMNLFGFVRRNNPSERRYKNIILFVARKNGKSFFSSVLPLYLMLTAGEGLQMYSLATKRDQSKIVWQGARRIISKFPEKLRDGFHNTITETCYLSKNNSYYALGRDSNTLDGLNPALSIFDEAAAITDRDLINVMTSATGANDNYLNLFITTASFNRTTAFYDKYVALKKTLAGTVKDDELFGLIYELDPSDKVSDHKVWIKANPNLNISTSLKSLKSKHKSAINTPTEMASFKVKNLNQWENSEQAWLTAETYNQCRVKAIDTSLPLYVGVDLASTSDLTSLVFIFKDDSGGYFVDSYCFLPKASVSNVPKHLTSVYSKAVNAGQLLLTEGKATSLKQVAKFLTEYIEDKDVREIGYDAHNSRDLLEHMDTNEYTLIAVPQTMNSLAPAAKTLERCFLESTIKYIANPFFEWQLGNVVAFIDINNRIKLKKGIDPAAKVDSVVALNIGMVYATNYTSEEELYVH